MPKMLINLFVVIVLISLEFAIIAILQYETQLARMEAFFITIIIIVVNKSRTKEDFSLVLNYLLVKYRRGHFCYSKAYPHAC